MRKTESSDFQRLNDLSLRLWQIADLPQGLDEMTRASIEMLGADMGNLQVYDPQPVLRIVSQRGFRAEFLEFFKEVSAEDESGCGRSLRSGQRTIIEDIDADPEYEPYRAIAARRRLPGCAINATHQPNRTASGHAQHALCRSPSAERARAEAARSVFTPRRLFL